MNPEFWRIACAPVTDILLGKDGVKYFGKRTNVRFGILMRGNVQMVFDERPDVHDEWTKME